MMEMVAYRSARQQVQIFSEELQSLQEHRQAPNSGDLDDLLRLGIGAFQWLQRAEQRWRETPDSVGESGEPDALTAFASLNEAWLDSSGLIDERVQRELERGECLECAAEYLRCREEAQDALERLTWSAAAGRTRQQSDEAW